MTERIWHKGPPPYRGWWNASIVRSKKAWRWWNGEGWSAPAYPDHTSEEAADAASYNILRSTNEVEWTDYWPENARVPRIDPREKA